MVKVKLERTADCVVAGLRVFPDSLLPSALLLGLYDQDGVLQHVGVASSFTERRRRELLERAEQELRSGEDQMAAGIELLWSLFSGPLFTAAIELWIAARTDAELREALLPAEREIGRGARRTLRKLFLATGGDEDAVRRVEIAIDMAANAMRGMALQQLLAPSPERIEHQMDFLKDLFSRYLDIGRQPT
jgi:hypothetical protein